jgi:hypothetical protein
MSNAPEGAFRVCRFPVSAGAGTVRYFQHRREYTKAIAEEQGGKAKDEGGMKEERLYFSSSLIPR